MPPTPPREALFLDHPGWICFGLLLIFVLIYLGLFLHEAGHWIAAKVFRQRILGMSLGEGRVLLSRQDEQRFFHLRLLPVEGYVVCLKEEGRESRSERFSISAAGPLATALFGLACLLLGKSLPQFYPSDFSTVVSQALLVTCVLEFLSLAYNLWPHYAQIGAGTVSNDGLSMLAALRKPGAPWENFYREALRDTRREADLPADSELEVRPQARERYLEYLAQLYQEPFPERLPLAQQILPADKDASREEIHLTLSAGLDLLLTREDKKPPDPALLTFLRSEADRLTQAHPEDPWLLATKGILAVEAGRSAEARLHLLDAESQAPGPRLKSTCLAWVSWLDCLAGHPREAKKGLEEAAELSPGNPAVARIATRVFGAPYAPS